MEEFHGRARRKVSGTGGRIKKVRDKVRSELGGAFTATKVGEKEVRESRRGRGSELKIKLKKAAFVNVKTKEGMKKAQIKNVVETPANRHYARQNIIVRGTIIDTEIGKVRVTNRVGQDGIVNGILL